LFDFLVVKCTCINKEFGGWLVYNPVISPSRRRERVPYSSLSLKYWLI